MTIMNSSIIPSALTSEPTLAKEVLEEYVNLGALKRVDNHKEHYAVQPCWIQDPARGVLEEINRNVLGRWSKKLEGYVVAVKNLRNYDNSAGMNEDHRWLHVDIVATYYTFCPEEGQRLKGVIKKVGNRAASVLVFDVFPVTVFATDEEMKHSGTSTWKVGDDIRFEIYAIVHRRKGPILRAKSLLNFNSTCASSSQRHLKFGEDEWQNDAVVNGTDSSHNESGDLNESQAVKREKKKKKKKRIKMEQEEDHDDMDVSQDNEFLEQNHRVELEEETPSKKKKKKKKSSYNE